MKEIRICDMDSDRVVLEAIMEGVNGLIRAKNEESAPSASTNMPSAAAILQAIDDNVECVETPNGKHLNRQQVVDCLNALSGTSHVG